MQLFHADSSELWFTEVGVIANRGCLVLGVIVLLCTFFVLIVHLQKTVITSLLNIENNLK